MYGDRLAEGGEEKLKVHCYRALLEQLLVARNPGLRHTQLRTVAQAHKMDFPSYVRQVYNGAAAGCRDPGPRDTELRTVDQPVSPLARQVKQWWAAIPAFGALGSKQHPRPGKGMDLVASGK